MTFELKIEFAGLCAFVQEAGGETVHVLLPEMEDGPRPVLTFDPSYLGKSGASDSGGAVEVDVHGARLELGADGPVPALPPEMPDLSTVARRGSVKDESVAARIVLHGGRLEQTDIDQWSLTPGPVKNMPATVRWTGECQGDELRLPRLGDAADAGELPPLHPIDGEIHLRIEHVSSLAPDDPVAGDDAAGHFAAYYPLLSPSEPPEPANS